MRPLVRNLALAASAVPAAEALNSGANAAEATALVAKEHPGKLDDLNPPKLLVPEDYLSVRLQTPGGAAPAKDVPTMDTFYSAISRAEKVYSASKKTVTEVKLLKEHAQAELLRKDLTPDVKARMTADLAAYSARLPKAEAAIKQSSRDVAKAVVSAITGIETTKEYQQLKALRTKEGEARAAWEIAKTNEEKAEKLKLYQEATISRKAFTKGFSDDLRMIAAKAVQVSRDDIENARMVSRALAAWDLPNPVPPLPRAQDGAVAWGHSAMRYGDIAEPFAPAKRDVDAVIARHDEEKAGKK